MRNILDIGKRGAEYVGAEPPSPVRMNGLDKYLAILAQFPRTSLTVEVNDGAKHKVGVHPLMLSNEKVFDLAWRLAPFEPMVYARQKGRTVMGMLSPNYDAHGKHRRSSIKLLPLLTPYPLIKKGADLVPDAQMATMLAGAARAEAKGSGGHDKPVDKDFEHRLTILGAVSLGKRSITENGRHVQHAVRNKSSVATGMTSGRLGNMFVPDGDRSGGFTGYGQPLLFEKQSTQAGDMMYIPEAFLATPHAFGANYEDAARIQYGAGWQILSERMGQSAVAGGLQMIARQG